MKTRPRSVVIAIPRSRNVLLSKDVGLAGGSWPAQGWYVKKLNFFLEYNLRCFLLCKLVTETCLIHVCSLEKLVTLCTGLMTCGHLRCPNP